MKIVQIITGSPSFGGAEAHVRDLCIGLRSQGHECVVLLGPPEGLFCEQLLSAGIPFVTIPALRKPIHPVWDVMSLCQILCALWRLRPDVVAAHTSKAGFIGRLAARLMGIPSFFTPHGLSFINRQDGSLIPFRLMLERLALCLGSRQIAVCNAERQLAIRWLSIGADMISTIHNGLPGGRQLRADREGPTLITMVARFDVQKDHATLLKALATLRHLDWKLCLAGDGALLPAVMKMARQYDLSSRVDFMHQCADIPALLARTDIFVLSSNWEAFPISILEAMRAGLPVVATDTGGIFEAVKDQENGFLFQQHDFNCLADRLSTLILSPAIRHEMGNRSRARFELFFDWRYMLVKTEMLYASALEDQAKRSHADGSDPVASGLDRKMLSPHRFLSFLRRPSMDMFLSATQSERSGGAASQVTSPRHSVWLSALALLTVDVIATATALSLSLFVSNFLGRPSSNKVVLQLCAIGVVALLALAMGGLYPSLGTGGLVESKRIFRIIGMIQAGAFIFFWLLGAESYQLSEILIFWVLSIIGILLARSSTRAFLSRRSWWGESILLVGSGDQVEEIADLLSKNRQFGLHAAGLLNEDAEPNPSVEVPVFKDLESAAAFCSHGRVQTAIIMLKPTEGLTVSDATSRYAPYFPNLIIFPLIGPRRGSTSRAKVLGIQLSIEASLVALIRNRRRLKRCIDLVLAIGAGALLSPLLLAIAIAVKLSSRGPVLFGHRRVGRYGKTFRAWKFRTMYVDAEVHLAERLAASPELRLEWERDHKLRNDPRITRVGAFLRKYSLDEIPQLWNAVCGEMSIVGPRPIITDEIVKYSDRFHCYSRVLPGITGLWQISGRNQTSYDERVELDTYYVNSWSLWLDLYIICRSFATVFSGRGAY